MAINYTVLFYILAPVAVVSLFVFLYFWSTYNTFVNLLNQVKTDYSDIDIQLKFRGSLLQNLADMVTSYAKHEKETYSQVAMARSAIDNSKTASASAKADNMITETLRSLFAVVESYPKLQASENFQKLQEDIKTTEANIANYREEYNQSVQRYNNNIQTFPNLLAAIIFNFKEAELFQISQTPDNKVII